MRTLEQCIEDADELADQVLNYSYELRPTGDEFKTLLETRSRYISARDSVDRARSSGTLNGSLLSHADITRRVFAAAYKNYRDNDGRIPYIEIRLVNETAGVRFERTIFVEDRIGDEFKYQVRIAEVSRSGTDGLLGDGATPATFFRPWPPVKAFHSLEDAQKYAENVRAESRLDGLNPIPKSRSRP